MIGARQASADLESAGGPASNNSRFEIRKNQLNSCRSRILRHDFRQAKRGLQLFAAVRTSPVDVQLPAFYAFVRRPHEAPAASTLWTSRRGDKLNLQGLVLGTGIGNPELTDFQVGNPGFPEFRKKRAKKSQRIGSFLRCEFPTGGSVHVQRKTGSIGQLFAQISENGGTKRTAAKGRFDEKAGNPEGAEFGKKIGIVKNRRNRIPLCLLVVEGL